MSPIDEIRRKLKAGFVLIPSKKTNKRGPLSAEHREKISVAINRHHVRKYRRELNCPSATMPGFQSTLRPAVDKARK